jgi:hypothetical protein
MMRMIFFVRKYERPIESNPFSDLYWFWTGRGQLDLQTVANALGNTLAVTQRHYNPWSQLRQSQQNAAGRRSWENDPLLKMLDETAKLGRIQ